MACGPCDYVAGALSLLARGDNPRTPRWPAAPVPTAQATTRLVPVSRYTPVTGTIFPAAAGPVSPAPELQDAPRQHPGQVRVPDQGIARFGQQRLVLGPGALPPAYGGEHHQVHQV